MQTVSSNSTQFALLLSMILKAKSSSSSYNSNPFPLQQLYDAYQFVCDEKDPNTQHQQLHNIRQELGLTTLVENEFHITKKSSKSAYPSELDTLPHDTVTYMLSRCPNRFYRRIRLLPHEFWIIFMELKDTIQKTHRSESNNAELVYKSKSGRPRAMHAVDELLLWFFHSDGLPIDLIALYFDEIDKDCVNSIADHITACINSIYESELEWPDAEERKASYGMFSVDEKAVAILDGTHCEIEAPVDLAMNDEYYSGYKKTTTQSYLVWCNVLGFILKVEGPFAGRLSDRSTYSTSEFAQPNCQLLNEGEKVIVDGGFWGEGEFILPAKMKMINTAETEQIKRELINYNLTIQDDRALIEHQIHVIKDRARALQHRYSRGLVKQSGVFYAASKLVNRIKRIRIITAMGIDSA
jgi:hypothetical protein